MLNTMTEHTDGFVATELCRVSVRPAASAWGRIVPVAGLIASNAPFATKTAGYRDSRAWSPPLC